MSVRTETQAIRFLETGESKDLGLRVVAWASTGLAGLIFCLISLGGLVRNAGAGLSCPDWPLCYGKVVPPMNYQVFLEWFHRLIAGSVSVTLLAISTYVFSRGDLRHKVGRYAATAICLLAAQIVLGGLTVLGLLDPKWVSSHLVVGMAFFGTVLLMSFKLRDFRREHSLTSTIAGPAKTAALATAVVYFQVLLGGLVSSRYAGLACPDFPTCNGAWIPPLTGLIKFQFMHRAGALGAFLIVTFLSFSLFRKPLFSSRIGITRIAIPVLLIVQIALGVGSVLLKLPLLMSVAHLATAAALFGVLLVTTYELRRN
jgi:cytochrome c oxidase assembly protein subunit 15